MAAVDVQRSRAGMLDRNESSGRFARLSTETKQAFKTTEFWTMIAVVIGVLIASALVDQGEGSGSEASDAFSASRAWLIVGIVAVGYMVSRGLAKAGSSEPYWADRDDLPKRDDS